MPRPSRVMRRAGLPWSCCACHLRAGSVPVSVVAMPLPRLLLVGALIVATGAAVVDSASATPTASMPLGAAPMSLPDRLRGVHDARQLVIVTAADNSTTTAVVRGYRRRDGAWHRVFGPWPAHLGFGGFAPRGGKREGDA